MCCVPGATCVLPHDGTALLARSCIVTVVLIPGLTCNETYWQDQIAALRNEHRIRVPSLHDLSSIEAMAAATLESADGDLDVVGHSMGGRVALAAYRQAPDRIRSLCLLDTGAHAVGDNEPAKRQVRLDIARNEGMTALAADWVPAMVHPKRREDRVLLDAISAMVTRYTVEQYEGQIAALLARPDERANLAEISCPTLVGCGSHDEWSPPEQHEVIAGQIPGARLEIVDGAGHMIAMEEPGATTELLHDWLHDVTSR